MIPTLRVYNPVDRSQFMTINAQDYRPAVHGELWPEQAADFTGVPAPRITTYSDAERKFAAELMLEVVAYQEQERGGDFGTLSPGDRMVRLRDYRNDFEQARHERIQRRAEHERFLKAATENSREAEKIVPGETPGHPVDAVTGKPLDLTDEQRQALANVSLAGAADGTATTGEPASSAPVQTQATATEPAAEPATGTQPAAPAWLKKVETPVPDALRVTKGPGGKWYVMRGKEVLSSPFVTKAEADTELEKLNA